MSDREHSSYDIDDILAEFHAQEKQAARPKPGTGKTTVFSSVSPKPAPVKPAASTAKKPAAPGIDYEKLPQIHASAERKADPRQTSQRIPPLSPQEEAQLRRRKRRAQAAGFRRAALGILLALALLLGGTVLYFRLTQPEESPSQGIELRLNESVEELSRELIETP